LFIYFQMLFYCMSLVIKAKNVIDDWKNFLIEYLRDKRGVKEEETLNTIVSQLQSNLKEKKRFVFCAYLEGEVCGFITGTPQGEVLEVVSLYVLPKSYKHNAAYELMKSLSILAFYLNFNYLRLQAKLPFNKEPSFEENLEKNGFKIITRNEMFLEMADVLDYSFTLPEGYAFEPFTLEKLDEIMQVVVDTNPVSHPDYYIYPEFQKVETAKQFLGQATDDFLAITPLLNPQLVYDGKIVGTSLVFTFQDKSAYIGSMNIHPDYQRKGLGRALLKNIILECSRKGVIKIGLAVTTSNESAYKLYQSEGFKVTTETLAIIKHK
ncbi:MAG: GNAT family N-acetyltransferase, partial [Candidatus Heimdallarchaeota archaeon]|nr:GNAT family N-acetyltransferase [Candidatus Heimdallarchaeota archaeon]